MPECPLANSAEEIQIIVEPELDINDVISRLIDFKFHRDLKIIFSENLDILLDEMSELEQCVGDLTLQLALVGICFGINIVCIW